MKLIETISIKPRNVYFLFRRCLNYIFIFASIILQLHDRNKTQFSIKLSFLNDRRCAINIKMTTTALSRSHTPSLVCITYFFLKHRISSRFSQKCLAKDYFYKKSSIAGSIFHASCHDMSKNSITLMVHVTTSALVFAAGGFSLRTIQPDCECFLEK